MGSFLSGNKKSTGGGLGKREKRKNLDEQGFYLHELDGLIHSTGGVNLCDRTWDVRYFTAVLYNVHITRQQRRHGHPDKNTRKEGCAVEHSPPRLPQLQPHGGVLVTSKLHFRQNYKRLSEGNTSRAIINARFDNMNLCRREY